MNALVIIALAVLGAIMLGAAILGACLVLVRLAFWREYRRRQRDDSPLARARREIWADRPVTRTPPGRAFDAAPREFWRAPPFTSRPKR